MLCNLSNSPRKNDQHTNSKPTITRTKKRNRGIKKCNTQADNVVRFQLNLLPRLKMPARTEAFIDENGKLQKTTPRCRLNL